MIEGPRESKKIDPIDRETLAVLGSRVEMWDAAQHADTPIEVRKQILETQMQRHIDALESSDEDVSAVELLELKDDLLDVQEFDGTEDEFRAFCAERKDYYVAVLHEFKKTL